MKSFSYNAISKSKKKGSRANLRVKKTGLDFALEDLKKNSTTSSLKEFIEETRSW